MLVLLGAVVLNVYLYVIVPKGFFPQQDTGQMIGGIQADQRISFQAMSAKLRRATAIVQADPAVESVVGFTGGRGTNSANVFVGLKPPGPARPDQRRDDPPAAEARRDFRRPALPVPAPGFFDGRAPELLAVPVHAAGRHQRGALYLDPQAVEALQKDPTFTDVTSDQQQGGLETRLVIDRPTAFRYGLTPDQIDNTLYDAFGQRQVSTIYNPLNQYHVVMEIAPRYLDNPETLKLIYVSTSGARARGSATTNAVAGTVASAATAPTDATSAGRRGRDRFGPQRRHQFHRGGPAAPAPRRARR